MSRGEATAFAPATIANVAVGFDLLGHSIAGPGDRVTARRTDRPGVTIASIDGVVDELPTETERNTAGRAVLALCAAAAPDLGVELSIDKGIPLSSGLGGSAASRSRRWSRPTRSCPNRWPPRRCIRSRCAARPRPAAPPTATTSARRCSAGW